MPVRFTGRAEGDLGHQGRWVAVDEVDPDVAARRAAVCELPWTWLRQVHGDHVVVVTEPGEHAGEAGDALVTAERGVALAILTADCAPVALEADGVVGAAHAGWRGLQAGVLQRTVEAMRSLGAGPIRAMVGPCIHAECYEFGDAELDEVAAALGDVVRGRTAGGRPALDVPAAVTAALGQAGVDDVTVLDDCTACDGERWYSHRARGDKERQALVVWR